MAKQVTIQRLEKKWEAFDGAQFDIKEECVKYENAAINVVKKRLLEKAIRPLTAYELEIIECGLSDEYKGYLLPTSVFNDIQMMTSLCFDYCKPSDQSEDVFVYIVSKDDSYPFFKNITQQVNSLNNLISEANG